MESILANIPKILHRYGCALDSKAVTKVKIAFDHACSDLGDTFSESDWTLKVTLTGLGDTLDTKLFEHSWSSVGRTHEEAAEGAYQEIVAQIQSALKKQAGVAQALAETLRDQDLDGHEFRRRATCPSTAVQPSIEGTFSGPLMDESDLPPLDAYSDDEADAASYSGFADQYPVPGE